MPKLATSIEDARRLAAQTVLQELENREGLSFASSNGSVVLAERAAHTLVQLTGREGERAEAFADWLVSERETAELFASDQDIEALLVHHWDTISVQEGAASDAAIEARNRELERQLREQPDEEELYLVYGDWLQEHGDVLGQLIMLQAAERDGDAKAKRRVQKLMREHGEHLLGRVYEYRRMFNLKWRLGFIHSLHLRRAARDEFQWGILLGWLLERRVARLLRELRLGPFGYEYSGLGRSLFEALLAERRPTLELLELHGSGDGEPVELYDVRHKLPRLRHLALDVFRLEMEPLELPHLQTLRLQIWQPQPDLLANLAKSELPALQELRVDWRFAEPQGAAQSVRRLQERFPSLREVSLSTQDD